MRFMRVPAIPAEWRWNCSSRPAPSCPPPNPGRMVRFAGVALERTQVHDFRPELISNRARDLGFSIPPVAISASNFHLHGITIVLEDNLIVVDEEDRIIGEGNKLALHTTDVRLHRAFSVFVFNSRNEVLLQQRSTKKLLWPLHWSNSYCSHPRTGESVLEAARRRSHEEIGLTLAPSFQYKFIYRARYEQIGEEFELCYVYTAHSDEAPVANQDETSQLRFVSVESMDDFIMASKCTPWFVQEWRQLSKIAPWLEAS